MAFQLPPNISFKKEKRSFGWVYLFRHSKLGQIGRIVPRGRADGRTQITCEVTNDPMTEKRAGIFKPLGKKIADEMERITNGGLTIGKGYLKNRIENKMQTISENVRVFTSNEKITT